MISPANVKRIIKKFGATGTLRQAKTVYDPESGSEAGRETANYPFTAVQISDSAKYAVNAAIRSSDLMIFMSCVVMPVPGAQVTWADKNWAVKAVDTLSPNPRRDLAYTVGLVAG